MKKTVLTEAWLKFLLLIKESSQLTKSANPRKEAVLSIGAFRATSPLCS
jgi:hypothetical protein